MIPLIARFLGTATSPVDIGNATPPVAGQILKATSATSATWQNDSAGTGDVVGPAGATDTALAIYDGATGKLIRQANILHTANGVLDFTTSFDLKRAGTNKFRADGTSCTISPDGGNTIIGSGVSALVSYGGTFFTDLTASLFRWKNAATTIIATLSDAGILRAEIPTFNSLLTGTVFAEDDAVSNVGAGEDDLQVYTGGIPANALNVEKRGIKFKMYGRVANVANTKRIRVYFGTQVILDVTASATSGANNWEIEGHVIRTGAVDTFDCYAVYRGNTGAGAAFQYSVSVNSDVVQDDAAAIAFKTTGEATSDADITQFFTLVECF